MSPNSRLWSALALVSAFVAGPAAGVQAPAEPAPAVDRLASAVLPAAEADAVRDALQRSDAWRDWSRRHPAWRAAWNLRTRTAHRMYGPGLHVRTPIADAAGVEAACRALLVDAAPLTGVRADALRLLAADHRLGRWYVVFEQVEDGVPVRGGRADVRLTDRGSVQLLGADWHREPRVDRRPSVTPEAALASAAGDLGPATDVAHELVIVPEPQGTGFAYRLAHELHFRTASPRGVWRAWVDAHTGELLQRENQIRWAQLSGHIHAEIEPETVGDSLQTQPLADTQFSYGAGLSEFGFTDVAGFFDVMTTAVDSVDVSVRLQGRWAHVFNASVLTPDTMFATPTINARMFPDTQRDFLWDESNSRASERDAYYHTLIAHENIKALDTTFTGVDYEMAVTVDITDRECNAFYDGEGINFLAEGMRCVNTARIADVVYHEYGHAITDQVYRPVSPSGAMHEAFSDYYAATITNQPLIGRGFRGPGTIIRTVDNDNTFPDDVVGEVHADGLILGGALWHLREALGRGPTDSLFHYARYGRSDNFDDYLLDVLVTDDDNGDIFDGTPRFDAIIAAFRRHGIGDYSVQIAHEPEPDTEDPMKPLGIEAVVLSIFALDPASLQLHYAINGGAFTSLPLAPTGMAVREYTATIPMQPAGTDIAYYLAAADTAGTQATLPPGGAAAPFTFRVGTDTTPPVMVHAPLPDQPVDSPAGWRLHAIVTDNLDRGVAGVQVEYQVNGGGGGSLALVPDGADGFNVQLHAAGANVGDMFTYRLVATDSALVPNTASDPPAGTHAFQVVAGIGRDLEANDGGLAGSGDWQWGEPVDEPAAFTGTNVWGTGIDGSYSNYSSSQLEAPLVDTTTWTSGALVFHHWFDSEEFFDGGNVEISLDGQNWLPIIPNGGYPFDFVFGAGGPGFSGDSHGWQRAEFELSQFVGQPLRFRWNFGSDEGVGGRGWFIDDIEIVARQVLSVPLAVQAQSGLDSRVPVRWEPPAGIDPTAPGTPLQGFNVYRAAAPDLANAVRLNASPLGIMATTFVDTTAVNGVTSYYAASALYADGESQLSNADAGQAFVAGYAADASALDMLVLNGMPADTTITFSNTGTGVLNLNVWLGEASDTDIDQVRIAYDRPPGKAHGTTAVAAARQAAATKTLGATATAARAATGATAASPATFAEWAAELRRSARPIRMPKPAPATQPSTAGGFTLLFTDTEESGPAPDLKDLLVEENPNGETRFRITAWAPWGNILNDFTLILAIDSDADRSTGMNGGFDYFVLIGAFAFNNFHAPAVVVQGMQFVGVPTHILLPNDSDALEIGFPFEYIGDPERVILQVLAFPPMLTAPFDLAPNVAFTAAWLQPDEFHVAVPAGMPTPLRLEFPAFVAPGDYSGKIFLETNAPATPVVTIPVDYHLRTTDIALADLQAVQEQGDVVVRWRTTREIDVAAFRVHRGRDGGPFEPLSPDVAPAAQRDYVFRDPAVEPGTYTYRIGEVSSDGSVTLHGAVEITVSRTAPAVSFLDPAVPNPFNPTTTLRFGVAVAGPVEVVVYDTRGRRTRTLWRAEHVEAGFHHVRWDGRDDGGQRVASGIYYAQMRTAGRAFTRRLTLVK